MPALHFEFHVEEVSMEAFLTALLPRVLAQGSTFRVYPYSGKRALLRKIGNRLRGYATWLPADHRIVIIVDGDGEECRALKSRLEDICQDAGLQSKRRASGSNWQVVTRIAIEELEAWYLGDWPAVCAAYPRVSPDVANRAPYRNPDSITGGTWEAFERVLQRHGYFRQGLAKAQVAAAIGGNVDPMRSRSRSFIVFRDAIAGDGV